MISNQKEQISNEKSSELIKSIKEWGITILGAIVIGFLLWHYVVYSVWIESGSMIPTLQVRDRLVATRVHNPNNLKEGDIVIFNSEELNETLIKRLIGLPGDTIEIKDGKVFRNGEELNETYVKNNEKYNGVFNVPEGEYFFLGDNRANSDDSRYWNEPYIKANEIEGKAKIKYYPIKDFEVFK